MYVSLQFTFYPINESPPLLSPASIIYSQLISCNPFFFPNSKCIKRTAKLPFSRVFSQSVEICFYICPQLGSNKLIKFFYRFGHSFIDRYIPRYWGQPRKGGVPRIVNAEAELKDSVSQVFKSLFPIQILDQAKPEG